MSSNLKVEWLETKYSADPCAFLEGEDGSFCGILKRAATTGPWTGASNIRCRQCLAEVRRWEKERRLAAEDDEGEFDLGSCVEAE